MDAEADQREAAREAGEKYGTMAADLSLVHVSAVSSKEEIHEQIRNLAHNIREQAAQQVRDGLGHDLADVWKAAAFKAAQMRLEALGGPGARPRATGSGRQAANAPRHAPLEGEAQHEVLTKVDACRH